MPFNGSGTYSAPADPGGFNPASSGGTLDPTNWNTLLTDLATALSTAICKDGQTTVTANIPMSSKKFTSLAQGVSAQDSIRFDQVLPAGQTSLAAMLRGYIAGCGLARGSTTTITVAAGVCMDDTNVQMIPISAGTINCATTGANGLDAGSLANTTWYHVFAIAKTDGTTALLASTSVSAPTQPTGYTLKRRIGSFRTNGSAQIIDFVQDGDDFQWVTMVNGDISATNPGTAAVTRTLTVPTGVRVKANLQVVLGNSGTVGSVAYLSDLSTTDTTPIANSIEDTPPVATVATAVQSAPMRLSIWTNTSAQIRSRLSASDANTGLAINTLGWTDTRGRNA